jgi:conjugal transfer pilus assembly protein TraB
MRNHKLIWNAGVSGILSGFGNAMQQSFTTKAVSPLGITNAIKSGKAFEYGAYSGANTALGKLADYYIKLADMYHPIVQVHAGSEVSMVFLKGFSLTEGLEDALVEDITPDMEKKDSDNQGVVQQSLMQNIRDSSMGQEIDINDTGDR